MPSEIGEVKYQPLNVPDNLIPRSGRFFVYSSDPDLAHFVSFSHSSRSEFFVEVCAQKTGKQTCRLHAVSDAADDPHGRGSVLATWLLVVSASPPTVKEVREVKLRLGLPSEQRLVFNNRMPHLAVFHISISDPAVVMVRTPELEIGGHDSKFIELYFAPSTIRDRAHDAEVFLFIRSSDRERHECHLLRLHYT